jgi:4-hydroxy-4-methyl-2-oxoglutarate aldolase
MIHFSEDEQALALRLGTSTLFESALLKNSAIDYRIRPLWKKACIVGEAYPVSCAPGDNLAIQLALEKAPEKSVLVVTTDRFIAGYWGEVLTVAAQFLKIKGLIIDGGVRDVEAIEARKFPVFSRAISMRGTYKKSLHSVGKPIQITGVPVEFGDWVVADNDGVIILPRNQAHDIIKKGLSRYEKEKKMMKELEKGKNILSLMGLESWRNQI